MKAKIYSWLLASAYLAWGLFLWSLIPKLQRMYSEFGLPVPSPVKVMFIAGPFGCLLITAVIGAVLALNTHRFHMRFVSFTLTIPLLAWIGYLGNVVFGTFMGE